MLYLLYMTPYSVLPAWCGAQESQRDLLFFCLHPICPLSSGDGHRHVKKRKHRPPDTTSLKIPIWNYNTYWKKEKFLRSCKEKQWFQMGSTFTSIWPTDLLTTTSRLVFSLFWIPPTPEYWMLFRRMSVNWLILHHIIFLTSEKKPTEKNGMTTTLDW